MRQRHGKPLIPVVLDVCLGDAGGLVLLIFLRSALLSWPVGASLSRSRDRWSYGDNDDRQEEHLGAVRRV